MSITFLFILNNLNPSVIYTLLITFIVQFIICHFIYDTDFIKCTMWSGVAENTSEYCKQGDLIGIKGRIQTRVIEKDNSKQTIQEVIAEKVTFLAKTKEKTDDEIEI